MDNTNQSNQAAKPQIKPEDKPQKVDTSQVQRDVLHVEVRNPDKVVFSGNAVAISSKNSVGPLDILPQHENFISLVNDKITIYQDKHQKQEIPNISAIIKNKLNNVNIFLGVESLMGMQSVTQSVQPASASKNMTSNPPKSAPAAPPAQPSSAAQGPSSSQKPIK